MTVGRRWTRNELLLALHLYERIPFGQQHQGNPRVVELAERLARTASSVAMKLNNLTSLDPDERARGVRGLEGASALDRSIWAEFHTQPELVEEAERLWIAGDSELGVDQTDESDEPHWAGATDVEAVRRVRLAQSYFRRVVLANFDGRCALTGVSDPALLTASHIVGWSTAPEHRVDPANGLCLNRLHDAAFDKNLITFDESFRLVVGHRLRETLPRERLGDAFLSYEGQRLRLAERRAVSQEFMARHREAFTRAELG